jgi:hypothetical protein
VPATSIRHRLNDCARHIHDAEQIRSDHRIDSVELLDSEGCRGADTRAVDQDIDRPELLDRVRNRLLDRISSRDIGENCDASATAGGDSVAQRSRRPADKRN